MYVSAQKFSIQMLFTDCFNTLTTLHSNTGVFLCTYNYINDIITTTIIIVINPDASGTTQLQANPLVAGPRHSHRKYTHRAVTMMGSNDLVIGEDHIVGPSCQRLNWQTGR